MSAWENEDLVTDTTRGFVYLIINTTNNKCYVGKKKAISETRVPVAGRKNKKRVVKPSNWRAYYGSCKELTADIKKLGKDKFRRIILGAYDELHTVSYGEAEIQFLEEVLSAKSSRGLSWYNSGIRITTMRYPEGKRDYLDRLEEVLSKL